ncbi:MAG: periplasmic heavy metal sensor [Flavobacterium sp.]|nr:periplasmic heavy metal sensor [Flavobacterium sp.]
MDIFAKQKIFIKSIILLIVMNITLIGFFIFREMKPPHKPLLFPKNEEYNDVSGILKKELNLSDNQVAQFDTIRKQNFEKQAALKEIIRVDKDAMNQEMFNKNSDETKVIKLAKKISQNEYQIELLHFEQAKKLKAVCNEKQLDKFEDLILEIRDYFRPDNQPMKR